MLCRVNQRTDEEKTEFIRLWILWGRRTMRPVRRVICMLTTVLLMLPLCACRRDTPEQTPPERTVQITVEQHLEEFSDTMACSWQIPRVSIAGCEQAAEKINAVLQAHTEQFCQTAQEQMTALAEYTPGNAAWSVPFSAAAAIRRADDRVVSITFDNTMLTDGMRPVKTRVCCNFDTATGEQLTLDGLKADREALTSALICCAQAQYAAGEINADYQDVIEKITAAELWYFSDEGMVFCAQECETTSDAYGIAEITVPYSELSGLIDDGWMPTQQPAATVQMSVCTPDSLPDSAVRYAALLDEDGEMLAICPDAEAFDVRLSAVQYNDGNGVYYEDRTLWYISRLTPQEALLVRTQLSDTVPNLQLSWRALDGTRCRRLLSQSGEDGSFQLLEPTARFTAQEISGQLPFSCDLDGDGQQEQVSLEAVNGARFLTVTDADGGQLAGEPAFGAVKSLWLADPDGDGRAELFLSTEDGCRCWRYTGTLEMVEFTTESGRTTCLDGWVDSFAQNEIVMACDVSMLGEYHAVRSFCFGADGCLAPQSSGFWQLEDNTEWLQTVQPLTAVLADEGETQLPSGSSLLLTATDRSSRMWFLLEDGCSGWLSLERGEDGLWQIAGQPASAYFAALPQI